MHQSTYEKEGSSQTVRLEEARLALLERTIESIKAVPLGPNSIKVRYLKKQYHYHQITS